MPTGKQESRPSNQLHDARRLWFSSYHGILSTHSSDMPGYPFGSLTPICRDIDGYPLLLVSHLAQHTQNLLANTHCSLVLIEQSQEDIQQWERLTCLAQAEQIKNIPTYLADRYFRYFPSSRDYFEKLNFQFYRLVPQRFYFIGGFGTARWFSADRLLPTSTFSVEDEIEHLTQLHSTLSEQGLDESITPVGIDAHGFDYRINNRLSRFIPPEPSTNLTHLLEQLFKSQLFAK